VFLNELLYFGLLLCSLYSVSVVLKNFGMHLSLHTGMSKSRMMLVEGKSSSRRVSKASV
jgi:hypothetical protein